MKETLRLLKESESFEKKDGSRASFARSLFSISLFHFVNDAAVVTLPLIYPVLYDQGFIITRYSQIGTVYLAGLAVTIVSQFLIGSFARERHYRKILPTAILCIGLSLILISTTERFLTFLLVFLMFRVSASFYHPVGIAWINTLARERGLDRSMGIQSAMGDLGVLVSFTIGGILAERGGWRFPVLLWAFVATIISIAGYITSWRGRDASEEKNSSPSMPSWREAFLSLKPLVPAFCLGGIAWFIIIGYAPSLLHHRISVSMAYTGYILAVWIGAGTVSSMLYGRIVAYIGHRPLLILSYAAVLFGSILLSITDDTRAAVGIMAVFGFFLFLTYPCLLSCVGKRVPDASSPGAFSIAANLQMMGGAVFSFIAGFLSDSFGIESPFQLLAAATFAIILYLLYQGDRPFG